MEPNSKTDIARTNRIKLTFRAARGRATGDGYEPAGRKLMTIIVGETAPRAVVFYHPSGKQICCVARTATTPGNAQRSLKIAVTTSS